jgi:hypothetical protein
MEKKDIIDTIDRINDYRFKRFRRDNLKEQFERMNSLGYEVTANDRKDLLRKAQEDLDLIEPAIKELILDIKQRYALHPKDKGMKLIILYIDLLDMEPMQMEKHRQKINALRPKVLGLMNDIDKLRNDNGLFDDQKSTE